MPGDLLAGFFDNPEVGSMLVFFGICVGIPTIAAYWYKLEKHKTDSELKRSMLERGMSAEEIERVLAAKSSSDKKERDSAH